MKDVGAIFMNVNPFYIITVEIATQMRPPFNYQATFPGPPREIGKGCTEQTGTDNQIIENHL